MKKIIKRSVVTEKSSVQIENKKFTFLVERDVNKIEIKTYIEKKFGVEVAKINCLSIKPKKVRRGRIIGVTSKKKKAIISLRSDKNIEKIKGIF